MRLFLHQLLVFGDDVLQRGGLELVIELHAFAFLDAVEDVFELLLGDVENHVAEHLDEAAIGVVGETGIVAALGQSFDGLVVEAQVEDGVHHAGHGELGAGADRNQQRIFARAQFLTLQPFQALEGSMHLGVDLRAQRAAHVFAAGFGLNGESGRHGQSGIGHLRQPGAFAAQGVFHAAVAVGRAAAEEVNILGWGCGCACFVGKRLVHYALRHGMKPSVCKFATLMTSAAANVIRNAKIPRRLYA